MNFHRYPLEVRAYYANIIWNGGSIGASFINQHYFKDSPATPPSDEP